MVPEPASAGAGGRDAERVYEPSSRARPIVRLDEQTHNRQVGHFKWAWGRKEPWDPTAAQEEARMNMLAGFPCARRRSTIPAVGIAAFSAGCSACARRTTHSGAARWTWIRLDSSRTRRRRTAGTDSSPSFSAPRLEIAACHSTGWLTASWPSRLVATTPGSKSFLCWASPGASR